MYAEENNSFGGAVACVQIDIFSNSSDCGPSEKLLGHFLINFFLVFEISISGVFYFRRSDGSGSCCIHVISNILL